jgi:outer membrane cobalamin receptor
MLRRLGPGIILFLPLALAAQRTPVLDTVRVQPLVVSISKVPLQSQRVGFSLTLLTQRELAATRPVYAADALRNYGGAYIDEAVGAGGPAIVRLRAGEEVFTQILMDGVQVNQNGGFFDFQGLTFGNVERVEIARGPQSAVWGSAAMTGVINFITRPGEAGPTRWNAQMERGAASERSNSYLGNIAVRGGNAKVRYSASGGTAFTRGFQAVPHDIKTREGVLRFDATPSDRFELTAIARAVGVEAHLPVRDPGATRVALDPNAQNDRDRYIGLLQATHKLGLQWSQRLRLSGYREDFLYQDTKDNVDASGCMCFIFDESFTFRDLLRRTTGEYLLTWERSERARLSAGVQWEREHLDERSGGAIGDGRVEFERDSKAGYAELQLTPVDRLDVLLSSRFEKYEGLEGEHTPRASVAFAVLPGRLRVRGAIARGFKAPNLQQQYVSNPFIEANPNLAAETSTSLELGGDVGGADSKVQISGTAFRQTFQNLIRTVAQENSERQTNRNLGASHATGVEWDVRVQPVRTLALIASGTFIRTKIEDNTGLDAMQYPEGGELPFRPAYTLTLGAEVNPLRKLTVGARARTVGDQFVFTERFSGRRVEIPSYTVLAANLEYAHRPDASAYLRIDNLLDKNYATAFDQRGMPMTIALGVRLGN